MSIDGATEYRNTSQLFIGVNVLKIVGARMEAPTGVGSGEGYRPLQWVWSLWPRKKFRFCPSKCWTFMHSGLWSREIVQQQCNNDVTSAQLPSVCIFRGVKLMAQAAGARECRGPLCTAHCTTYRYATETQTQSSQKHTYIFVPSDIDLWPLGLKFAPLLLLASAMFPFN